MPVLDVMPLNVTIAVVGAYLVVQGLFSVVTKNRLFLGEALPALLTGIALGPLSTRLLSPLTWGPGSLTPTQQSAITLGFMRVLISTQLLQAGYQLPARYPITNLKPMFMVLLPIMTLMWLCTTACLAATLPASVSVLACLAIGACVTSTDPVLSQALAKGPFAERYVARPLREIISAEAGANDGLGFPFLMLATYLLKLEAMDPSQSANQEPGVRGAIETWGLETWLYVVVLSVPYGAAVGFGAGKAIGFCLRRKWIDAESYLLFPVALALFTSGTCGCLGTDDLLASFCAGAALNWDGAYQAESEQRQDEVNPSVDALLNATGFMYVGAVMPWASFHDPDGTGITLGRLFGLGFLVLVFRRIPALLLTYRAMPTCVKNWREAVFMGYFGPIGVGAVFYVEYARPLFPTAGSADESALLGAIGPCVYFLVLFSIVVHGLSVPALHVLYRVFDVAPARSDECLELENGDGGGATVDVDDDDDDDEECGGRVGSGGEAPQLRVLRRLTLAIPTPVNALAGHDDAGGDYFVAFNSFSRPVQRLQTLHQMQTLHHAHQTPADEEAGRPSGEHSGWWSGRSRPAGSVFLAGRSRSPRSRARPRVVHFDAVQEGEEGEGEREGPGWSSGWQGEGQDVEKGQRSRGHNHNDGGKARELELEERSRIAEEKFRARCRQKVRAASLPHLG